MPDYLQDYKNYYLLRMQRFEDQPDYVNSYRSEKAIYEAIASCSTLEEFRDKLGDLNEKNAVALITDEYGIRLKHYESIRETIKAEGCRRIIEKAASIRNVQELIAMVNEEENKTSLAVTADTISPFNDVGFTERIAIWEQADVPEKYRSRYQVYAGEEKANLRKAYLETEKAIGQYQPGWTFDYDRIREERHRRLLPFPDEVLSETIQQVKSIRHAG